MSEAVPAVVEYMAGRPIYHTTCHDCLMEAVHPSLREAASEERAHRRAHPEHTLSTERVDR